MARRKSHRARTILQTSESEMKNLFVIQFIGSIILLIIVLSGFGIGYQGSIWGRYIWQPLFYAAALFSSALLLFSSFFNQLRISKHMANASLAAAFIAGASVIGMVYGNIVFLSISLVGFALSFIGAGMSNNIYYKIQAPRLKPLLKRQIFAIQLIGSLLVLYILLSSFDAAYPLGWVGLSPLQELLYSLSLAGGISLIFISFLNYYSNRGMPHGNMFIVVVTSLSLLILTFGNLFYFSMSLVAMVVLVIGADLLWRII